MSTPRIEVKPLEADSRFGIKAYRALKRAITEMDIYSHAGEVRLDERELSLRLGVSRTPIREAMTVLEHEGFVRSVTSGAVVGPVGFIRWATMTTFGTNSRSSSNRFATTGAARKLTPVTLPAGWLRLATSPSRTGSSPVANTIGMVVVAAFAASAAALPAAMITAACRRTRSAANAGSRS